MAEADFEAPLVELQKRIDELARWPGDPEKEQQAATAARGARRDAARGLLAPHAVAEDPGRAQPEPAVHARLRAGPLHRVDRAARATAATPTIRRSCAASRSTATSRCA